VAESLGSFMKSQSGLKVSDVGRIWFQVCGPQTEKRIFRIGSADCSCDDSCVGCGGTELAASRFFADNLTMLLG